MTKPKQKKIKAWAVGCSEKDFIEGVEMTKQDAIRRAEKNLMHHTVFPVTITYNP